MTKKKKQNNLPVFDGSRDSCRRVFDAIGDPVLVTRLENGKIIEINKAALSYIQARRTDVIGKDLVELGWWKDAAERQEFVQWLDSEGAISRKEMVFRKDGRALIFKITARRIMFHGELAIFNHLADVTEERQRAHAFMESEMRLKEAERMAGLGHWKYIPAEKRLVWSDENFRLLGYEPGEIMPSWQTFLDRVHSDDRKKVWDAFHDAVEEKQDSYEILYRVLPGKKETRFVKERTRLSFSDDGRLMEAIGISQDVTREYEAYQRLQRSEKRWNETFNAIEDCILLLDKEYNTLLANNAATKLLGMDLPDIIGKKCYHLIHSEKKVPPENCPFLETVRTRTSQRKEIYISELSKTFLVTTCPVFDSLGDIEYVVHLAHDISVLKETEAMLRHAQKMEAIGTLAGGIAHDFNNILTGTAGFLELALMPRTDLEKARKYMNTSLKLLNRASELVKQILTFGRQDEQTKGGPVILNVLIKEIVKMLRASMPPAIEISTELPEHDVTVCASPVNIHQVIMNLCTNAYQAMEDTGGRLTIRLNTRNFLPGDMLEIKTETGSLAKKWAHLQVEDTGCGIPPEIRDRIFEPYFTTKRPGEGTGLGLSMVHGIIKRCNGYVALKSEPGKGSTFDVFLPLAEDASGSSKEGGHKDFSRGKGKVILVDDESSIVSLLKVFLEDIGYQVEGFTDPFSALEAFRNTFQDVDILITDMAMPKMSGTDLVRAVRDVRADIPVIMLTGLLDYKDKDAAKTDGVDVLLQKPIRLEVLSENIQKLMEPGSSREA